MSRVAELLEKFEDIFKSISDEELEKRMDDMDTEDLHQLAVESIPDIGTEGLKKVFNIWSVNTVDDLIHDYLRDTVSLISDVKKFIRDCKKYSGKEKR